jgi:hypothetical protein
MALTVSEGTGNPIKVTGTATSDETILTGTRGLKFVYWYNPTTTGHLCNLIDVNGNPIIPMRANSNNDTQIWPIFKYVEEIHCDDMDSGTLYLYLR